GGGASTETTFLCFFFREHFRSSFCVRTEPVLEFCIALASDIGSKNRNETNTDLWRRITARKSCEHLWPFKRSSSETVLPAIKLLGPLFTSPAGPQPLRRSYDPLLPHTRESQGRD